jgi:4-aminobutyrate aminotransferase-like enzyme
VSGGRVRPSKFWRQAGCCDDGQRLDQCLFASIGDCGSRGNVESFMEKGATSHFRHINTFAGNPVCCAVGLENMNILEREDLVERSASLGEGQRKRMEVLSTHPYVGEIRYFGSACCLEMVEDRATKEPRTSEKVLKVILLCKQNGLLTGRNGDTVPGFANVLRKRSLLSRQKKSLFLLRKCFNKPLRSCKHIL